MSKNNFDGMDKDKKKAKIVSKKSLEKERHKKEVHEIEEELEEDDLGISSRDLAKLYKE